MLDIKASRSKKVAVMKESKLKPIRKKEEKKECMSPDIESRHFLPFVSGLGFSRSFLVSTQTVGNLYTIEVSVQDKV